jgi:hypothetical protein
MFTVTTEVFAEVASATAAVRQTSVRVIIFCNLRNRDEFITIFLKNT